MTDSNELVLESRISEGLDRYRFETLDGVLSKKSFRSAELCLLESLYVADLGRLLVLDGNYGVVGTVLAASYASVHVTESSARAARLCERNARMNGADVTVSVVPECTAVDDAFDAVAYAPKPYTPIDVGKQRIANALSVLRPGGVIYVAASMRAGLARYEDCLRTITEGAERRTGPDECRLLAATRPSAFDPPT